VFLLKLIPGKHLEIYPWPLAAEICDATDLALKAHLIFPVSSVTKLWRNTLHVGQE
jgi:hypothetical protein